MAAILKIQDIDDAISNLNYKSRETLKYKLIQTLRQYYTDDSTVESLQSINHDELIKALWCTGDDPETIKGKRRNLSSIKSSVNADLKRLYHEGGNPQGVIVGQNNIFDMSDEAKDKALESIAAVLKEKGADTIGKIAEVLSAVSDILSNSGSLSKSEDGNDKFDRVKGVLLDLSRKMGLSLPGDMGTGTVDSDGSGLAGEDINGKITDDLTEMVEEEALSETTEEVMEDHAWEVEIVEEVWEDEAAVGGSDSDEALEEKGSGYPEGEPPVEAGVDEILVADEDVHEIIEKAADEITVSEPVGEGEAEEIAVESELEEVDGEEIPAEQEIAGETIEEAGAETVDEVLYEVEEEDLSQKAELLARLADAAKVLEKLGPGLDETIYSEKEIKEKAKFLAEEFERDLSVREKYFNQHILIKGGEYITGGGNSGKFDLPAQNVYLPEFYIGKFPVTNALFEIFVDRTGYRTTAEKRGYGFVYTPRTQRTKDSATGMETFVWSSHLQYKKVQGACWHQPSGPGSSLYNKRRHPVVQVSLEDARAFAAWTGKRIPMEKEWEAAARTSQGFIYPWGNQWKENACNIEKSCIGDTTPVDKYLELINSAGVADTLGNVLEWTLDPWRAFPSGEENTDIYVVKGGSWISDSSIRLSIRFPMDKNTTSNILGFRCVAI